MLVLIEIVELSSRKFECYFLTTKYGEIERDMSLPIWIEEMTTQLNKKRTEVANTIIGIRAKNIK